ncbi:hypothetical protein COLO4_02336 [Corchorus olitorius]|uniref:Uncharacterized protein n=1 Tax=Corchorus olitorius TaxID=93759 RepID=A0A1R3L144_9ROSI|nr:hypothetical protein COLO4_02336 [Corchorus olitorius]
MRYWIGNKYNEPESIQATPGTRGLSSPSASRPTRGRGESVSHALESLSKRTSGNHLCGTQPSLSQPLSETDSLFCICIALVKKQKKKNDQTPSTSYSLTEKGELLVKPHVRKAFNAYLS